MPLRRPSPLPPRFRRAVSPATRHLVFKRLHRHRREWFTPALRQFHRLLGRLMRRNFLPLVAGMFLVVTVVGMVLVLFSPWTKVQEIRVIRRDARVDIARVQQALLPLFGQRLFTISVGDVLPLLQESFPDITEVDVTADYPSRLFVHLHFDPLVARLQIIDPEEQSLASSGALLTDFLTEHGIAVTYAPNTVRNPEQFPLINLTDWGVRPRTGERILERTILQSMREAEEMLQRDFDQEIHSRLVFLRAQEFHLQGTGGWFWFDVRSPTKEQLHRYRLFLQEVPRKEVREYVDLRLADRVVYK